MNTTKTPIIFGTHDQNTLDQLAQVSERADICALMADGHLGYIMPIGGVAAYKDKISVCGVGFDIACGNCAMETNLHVSQFSREGLEKIADEIQSSISFGVGRKNTSLEAPVDHPLFESGGWDLLPSAIREPLRDKARAQLGTVGSGNHYVDVLVDERGCLWVGVHFGSRGFGHTIASGFLALGTNNEWGQRVQESEVLLDINLPLGQDYYQLMTLAGEYAYAGREWVAETVARKVLGGDVLSMVHNHHNFAWRESHFGQDYFVVRKGATPAFPGQKGFVGGSMGDKSVILKGAEYVDEATEELQRESLYSTVHGAGRVMSRTEAAGKVHRKTGLVIKEGKVTSQMMGEWLDRTGVILRGGGLDESPHVYRRLEKVLEAQGPTIDIVEVLTPLVVVMAGANEFDPYKD